MTIDAYLYAGNKGSLDYPLEFGLYGIGETETQQITSDSIRDFDGPGAVLAMSPSNEVCVAHTGPTSAQGTTSPNAHPFEIEVPAGGPAIRIHHSMPYVDLTSFGFVGPNITGTFHARYDTYTGPSRTIIFWANPAQPGRLPRQMEVGNGIAVGVVGQLLIGNSVLFFGNDEGFQSGHDGIRAFPETKLVQPFKLQEPSNSYYRRAVSFDGRYVFVAAEGSLSIYDSQAMPQDLSAWPLIYSEAGSFMDVASVLGKTVALSREKLVRFDGLNRIAEASNVNRRSNTQVVSINSDGSSLATFNIGNILRRFDPMLHEMWQRWMAPLETVSSRLTYSGASRSMVAAW